MAARRPPEEITPTASGAREPSAADREVPAHQPLREGPTRARPGTSAEQPAAELALLADVSIRLLSAPRPETLAPGLLARLAELLRLDLALNYLLVDDADDVPEDDASASDSSSRMRLNAGVGVDEDTRALLEVPGIGEAISVLVARTRSPVVRDDVQTSDDRALALVRRLGVSAYACFPLVTYGDVIGTLSFGRGADGRFDARELALLAAFADQFALALHRRRLVAALEAQVGESERARAAAEQARREAEVARAAAESARLEAAEASRAKSGFLATMSHELRTPINAMLGYTQLLELGLAGPLTEQQRGYLERLTLSSQHLLGLVNDILDLSRIEAGETRVARRDSWTGAAVYAAMELVRPQAAERGVRLIDAGPAEQGLPYVGDEDRVRQILVNLLSNAVKFTAAGGTVTVTCDWLAETPAADSLHDLHGSGPWVSITVADTGIGIPPEEQDRIFEPFHQVDRGHTRTAGGTGLGLAISRRLARLMGGDLTVESAPGAGSTFTLRLPAARRDDGGQAETARERGARSQREAATLRTPGLGELGEVLRDAVNEILTAYSHRLRADPALPNANAMRAPELEDHQLSLLGDFAQSLVIVGEGGAEGADLLRDGSAIQRTIADRHGARRHAQGWDEAAVRRDHQILREEVARAVLGRTGRASAEGDAALTVLLRLIDRAEAISVAAWRRAAAAR
ncbi:MAG TPA: ATP-binding protein [Gemmatimonadaceae bacterium]|nr:ATP-binding protein [Gemmatimonadaceae bacterium]